MSRSGYSDDGDVEYLVLYRQAVDNALAGKRGQAFLKEMAVALDILPGKRLIDGELEADGEVCALGAVGRCRGLDMTGLNIYDFPKLVADAFGIAQSMAAEIMYENDEGCGYWNEETPEQRWARIRRWVESKIVNPETVLQKPGST